MMIIILTTGECKSGKTPPNFLLMIADDLGYGDIEPFGNRTLPTPNLQRLADNGVKLTHHLTAASLCTPSRAALLTGRYPIRYGLTSAILTRVLPLLATNGGLPQTELTIPKLLKQAKLNYSTGLIGKWHLGLSCGKQSNPCHHPLKHGFDYFYGLPFTNIKDFDEHSSASVILSLQPFYYYYLTTFFCIGFSIVFALIKFKFKKLSIFIAVISIFIPLALFAFQRNLTILNSILMRDYDIIEQPINMRTLTARLVNETKQFINQSLINQQPFFTVLAFSKVHTAHFPNEHFSKKSKHGKYGDCVMEMDAAIGEVIEFLNEMNLSEQTFVYFTSDNGGHIEELSDDRSEHEGGYNGPFSGGKAHGAIEGGIRVPGIVSWKNFLPEKKIFSSPTSQMDILPTVLDIVNLALPNDRIIDGKSFLGNLLKLNNENNDDDFQINFNPKNKHKFLFHYCGSYLQAVRYYEDKDSIWKLYFFSQNYAYYHSNSDSNESVDRQCKYICRCTGNYIIKHNRPLLYNIAKDLNETLALNQFNFNESKYNELLEIILHAVDDHKRTISTNKIEQQLNFLNTIWRPDLQPCCNFPHCSCSEY